MMNTADLLNIFNRHRGDAIVIPGRGGRHWVNISDQPDLDVPLVAFTDWAPLEPEIAQACARFMKSH